jgi:hypothetical protein
MATAIGAAVALIPSCFETLYGYFWTTPPIPITPVHLGELIIFGVAVGIAFVTWRVTEGRKKQAIEVAAQIRGQPAL